MNVKCLDLADFLVIAETITGDKAEALTRLPRLRHAEHALSTPNAGIGEVAYYPTFAEKAAAMTYFLIKGHPLPDGNKRAGYVCLLMFVRRNGYQWTPPPNDGPERVETVRVIESVASGAMTQPELATWIDDRLTESPHER